MKAVFRYEHRCRLPADFSLRLRLRLFTGSPGSSSVFEGAKYTKFLTLPVQTLQWAVEDHRFYERSLFSLKDLLSIVLLRVTTPTAVPDPDVDTGEFDEDLDQKLRDERESQRKNILGRITKYLVSYCKRYGRSLTDPKFVQSKPPEVLFQNHQILGRVLMEFANKAEEFTSADLFRCFWWVWAPIVWPELVGFEGNMALQLMEVEHPVGQIQEAWHKSGLSGTSVLLMTQALGTPPSWQAGLYDTDRVRTFMAAREWTRRVTQILGEQAFQVSEDSSGELIGIPSLSELTYPGASQIHHELSPYLDVFERISNFQPPAQEKYRSLIALQGLRSSEPDRIQEKARLVEEIERGGLQQEYDRYQKLPLPILRISDEDPYCPRCYGKLTAQAENQLNRGQLVLCTVSKDAWIFKSHKMPESLSI